MNFIKEGDDLIENKFDFIVPHMKNEIAYHVQYKNNIWSIQWNWAGKTYTDTTDEEELREYLNNGTWKKIIVNKNRRI
jgi:hypothetical protein